MTTTAPRFDGRTEHAIWSEAAGGFVATGIWSPQSAADVFAALVRVGRRADDLCVMAMCEDHRVGVSTLTALDWPKLLDTPMTRWYLDRLSWEDIGQCDWQANCPNQVIGFVEYQVAALPGDDDDPGREVTDLVCSKHLPDMIAHALEGPLVADTVVEVGVDPALLRLTGVDPAVVEQFKKHALGCAA